MTISIYNNKNVRIQYNPADDLDKLWDKANWQHQFPPNQSCSNCLSIKDMHWFWKVNDLNVCWSCIFNDIESFYNAKRTLDKELIAEISACLEPVKLTFRKKWEYLRYLTLHPKHFDDTVFERYLAGLLSIIGFDDHPFALSLRTFGNDLARTKPYLALPRLLENKVSELNSLQKQNIVIILRRCAQDFAKEDKNRASARVLELIDITDFKLCNFILDAIEGRYGDLIEWAVDKLVNCLSSEIMVRALQLFIRYHGINNYYSKPETLLKKYVEIRSLTRNTVQTAVQADLFGEETTTVSVTKQPLKLPSDKEFGEFCQVFATYTVKDLTLMYREQFAKLYLNQQLPSQAYAAIISKSLLQSLIGFVFWNKELFDQWLDLHDIGYINLLNEITFSMFALSREESEKKFPLLSQTSNNTESVRLLFPIKMDYRGNCWLEKALKKALQKLLSPPENAVSLISLNLLKNDKVTIYTNGDAAIRDLDFVRAYVRQNIKNNCTAAEWQKAVKKAAKALRVKEFYPGNGNAQLATAGLELVLKTALMLNNAKIKTGENGADNLKEFVDFLLNKSHSVFDFYLHELLFFYRGDSWLDEKSKPEMTRNVLNSITRLLMAMDGREWIYIKNFYYFASLHNLHLNPPFADEFYFYNYNTNQWRDKERVEICDDIVNLAIVPFVNTFMALLAQLNMLDLAYLEPEHPYYSIKGCRFLTPFDGFVFVKLTGFGRFVLGLNTSYQSEVKCAHAKIALDPDRLLVYLDAADPEKELILNSLGEKISTGCYRVSDVTFLKGKTSKVEIETKINYFTSLLSDKEIPPLWQTFFDSLPPRLEPLTEVEDMLVYKIAENPQVLQIIATDPLIKTLVFKAEGYHLLLLRKNLAKLKKRLAELGFYLGK